MDAELPASMKKYLAQNNINFYIIDAVEIAEEIGLGGRINMIMQSAFFKIADIIPIDDAVAYLKQAVEKSYGHKGEHIVKMNNAAIDHGINVPEDMQVVGMMDTSYATICRPPLTTIHVPVYDMGAIAIRLLTKILNHEEIDEAEVPMHYTFIKRDTTK